MKLLVRGDERAFVFNIGASRLFPSRKKKPGFGEAGQFPRSSKLAFGQLSLRTEMRVGVARIHAAHPIPVLVLAAA